MTERFGVYVEAPLTLYVDGVTVGRTLGGTTFAMTKDYAFLRRMNRAFDFDAVKTNVVVEVSFACSTLTATTLKLAFDQSSVTAPVDEADFAYVGAVKRTFSMTAAGLTWQFGRVVMINSPAIPFSHEEVTTLPVTLRCLLEGNETTPTLGGSNLPGQTTYRIAKPKRVSTLVTFGGRRHSEAASLLDIDIVFQCGACTDAQKGVFDTQYAAAGPLAFTGVNGETASVYFNQYDAPEQSNGLWTVSGTLTVA